MSFTAKDITGALVTLKNNDKITNIASRSVELYITDIIPVAHGMKRRAKILAPVDVIVSRFSAWLVRCPHIWLQ